MENFIQLKNTENKNNNNDISDNIDNKKPSKHKVKYHNIIITLLALLVMPIYLYGTQVIFILLTGLVTAFVIDFICIKLIRKRAFGKYDYSSVVTVLITVMLMPATVPLWVVSVSIAIGICVAKYPFGGTGHNIFNPAAVGLAFCALCWPEYVLRYPVPFTTYKLPDMSAVQYAPSPASVLSGGGTPKIDFFDVLLGKFVGPLGATCMIVLGGCMIYLIFRKVISKRIVFSALFVVCVCALLFPRVITGHKASLIYELSSGAFAFGIIFMSSDPTTMPETKNGRVFYGALIGILVMMFRYFGQIELEFVYAILLANVFASSCDTYAKHLQNTFNKLKLKGKPLPTQAKNVEVGGIDE